MRATSQAPAWDRRAPTLLVQSGAWAPSMPPYPGWAEPCPNADRQSRSCWRAVLIKEQRSDLVKQHLWVLWTDYFKPEHLERFPDLHDKFWKATKTAGECKKTNDVAVADRLLAEIAAIDAMFWESKK